MVILLQICIFGFFALIRGRKLLGKHLELVSPGSDVLDYTSKRRGTYLARHIGLAVPGAIPFVVRRERFYHRLLKMLGIASEIQVGNDGFDGRYFVTTDFPGHLEQLLASKELQAHVHELLTLPVVSLHTTHHRIWCEIARGDYSKPQDHFEKHLHLLRQIAGDIQASLTPERSLPAARWRGVAALSVIVVHAGLLMFGMLGFLPTFADSVHTADTGALLRMGLVAGAVAALVWLPSILAVFSGSSWSPWVLTDFLISGLIGFVLAGVHVVREVNVQMPQPEARQYQLPVLQKACTLSCSSGRRSRSTYPFVSDAACSPPQRQKVMAEKKQSDPVCARRAWFTLTLDVKHWREQDPYSFDASEQLFDAVRTGRSVTLPVHPGALGLEWVDWEGISAK